MPSAGREAPHSLPANEQDMHQAAHQAEMQGRAVILTVEGFKQAIAREGYDAIARALISRHNRRFERLAQISPLMQTACLPILTGYIEFDVASRRLNAAPRPKRIVRNNMG